MKRITKKELKKLEKKETKRKDEEWKLAVFKKYGKKCAITGSTQRLQVHHFYPKKAYPQLRWVVENGVPLTQSIHFRIEKLKEWKYIYQIIVSRGIKWLNKLLKKI
jgi:5-methylcytosine-specific restriction endonuclease McrA